MIKIEAESEILNKQSLCSSQKLFQVDYLVSCTKVGNLAD
jgi:hypothetical protein